MKKLILAFLFISTTIVSAQEGTSSPYSFYGLGDVKFKGTNDLRQMGGMAVAGDSVHLNLLNPASYAKLRLTSFAVGGTGNFNNLSNNTTKETAQRFSLDYLAVGLPMGKLGFSFGIMPFTNVGYRTRSEVVSDDNTKYNNYKGDGGINRAFIGAGYNLTKNLSIGAEYQYNFGDIATESIVFMPNIILGTREQNNSNIKGNSFNIGAFYTKDINEKYFLNASLTYSPEANFTSANSRNVVTVSVGSSGSLIQDVDPLEINVNDTKLTVPKKYSFGTGFGQKNKWFIGAEYTFQENSKLGNRFDDIANASFENSQKYAIGGFYIPKYNSFSKYLERVTYRAGFRYENTGLVINNTPVNDYGMNFGLGLPVGGRLTSMNVGFEFGKRGTTSNNLIQENYFNFTVGLSINDLWFIKRKYD